MTTRARAHTEPLRSYGTGKWPKNQSTKIQMKALLYGIQQLKIKSDCTHYFVVKLGVLTFRDKQEMNVCVRAVGP
jgi:hypothetical protein